MAWRGSWDSIRKHGLLSTQSLLELFDVDEQHRTELLEKQRKDYVRINHPNLGIAHIRDQKPLSEKKLTSCLHGCDARTWYRILNERVFFWLNRQRLEKMMSAREYVGKYHTILHVDAEPVARRYRAQIELAHMNTGNTLPVAHPRGPDTFRSLDEYPYDRRRKLPDYSAVVEITIRQGIPDIWKYVRRAEHAGMIDGKYQVNQVIYLSDGRPRNLASMHPRP